MRIFFYDVNFRYIGSRELEDGEEFPTNATSEIATVKDGEEAYLVDSKWVVSKIVEQPIIQE